MRNYSSSDYKYNLYGMAAAAVVIIVGAMFSGYLNEQTEKRTWEVIKPGAKLYADTARLRDTAFTGVSSYRRVRKLQAKDIEALDIPNWKKVKLIAQLDTTNNEPAMIDGDLYFDSDKIFKQQTCFLGDYVKSDSTTGEYDDAMSYLYDDKPKKRYVTKYRVTRYNGRRVYRKYTDVKYVRKPEITISAPKKWYAININSKITSKSSNTGMPPKGYIFADDFYYVRPINVVLSESDIFKAKQVAKGQIAGAEKW